MPSIANIRGAGMGTGMLSSVQQCPAVMPNRKSAHCNSSSVTIWLECSFNSAPNSAATLTASGLASAPVMAASPADCTQKPRSFNWPGAQPSAAASSFAQSAWAIGLRQVLPVQMKTIRHCASSSICSADTAPGCCTTQRRPAARTTVGVAAMEVGPASTMHVVRSPSSRAVSATLRPPGIGVEASGKPKCRSSLQIGWSGQRTLMRLSYTTCCRVASGSRLQSPEANPASACSVIGPAPILRINRAAAPRNWGSQSANSAQSDITSAGCPICRSRATASGCNAEATSS